MIRQTWRWLEGCDGAPVHAALRRVGFPLPDDFEKTLDTDILDCVVAYQQDCGLAPDGIVGPKTWAQLDRDNTQARPVAPTIVRPEIERINSLLLPVVWGQCGYYSMTSENTDGYLIRKAGAVQRAAAKVAKRKATHGMTCGHFGDYFAKLYLGTPEPRVRHTGMNLTAYYRNRDIPITPSSTVGAGLLAGLRTIDAGTWKPKVHGCSGDIIPDDPGTVSELAIVEYGSHIICCLDVAPDSGIIDPRTGLLARPGKYRVGADGTKWKPGTPWTFRMWRESDSVGIRHMWRVRRSHARGLCDVQAWLEV